MCQVPGVAATCVVVGEQCRVCVLRAKAMHALLVAVKKYLAAPHAHA